VTNAPLGLHNKHKQQKPRARSLDELVLNRWPRLEEIREHKVER